MRFWNFLTTVTIYGTFTPFPDVADSDCEERFLDTLVCLGQWSGEPDVSPSVVLGVEECDFYVNTPRDKPDLLAKIEIGLCVSQGHRVVPLDIIAQAIEESLSSVGVWMCTRVDVDDVDLSYETSFDVSQSKGKECVATVMLGDARQALPRLSYVQEVTGVKLDPVCTDVFSEKNVRFSRTFSCSTLMCGVSGALRLVTQLSQGLRDSGRRGKMSFRVQFGGVS